MEVHNTLQLDSIGFASQQKLSRTSVSFNTDHHHTRQCTVYVLTAGIQSSLSQILKWQPNSRVRVYVGHSPSHAASVDLVLDPLTGHVSP